MTTCSRKGCDHPASGIPQEELEEGLPVDKCGLCKLTVGSAWSPFSSACELGTGSGHSRSLQEGP
jgi:hypothetical protein